MLCVQRHETSYRHSLVDCGSSQLYFKSHPRRLGNVLVRIFREIGTAHWAEILNKIHKNFLIVDLNLQPSSHKTNALPTELPKLLIHMTECQWFVLNVEPSGKCSETEGQPQEHHSINRLPLKNRTSIHNLQSIWTCYNEVQTGRFLSQYSYSLVRYNTSQFHHSISKSTSVRPIQSMKRHKKSFFGLTDRFVPLPSMIAKKLRFHNDKELHIVFLYHLAGTMTYVLIVKSWN